MWKMHISKIKILKMYRGYLKLLQNVVVISLDPIQHHVVQVVSVPANQMLMAPNVQFVSQVIMDFPTAKVKVKSFQFIKKA